MVAASVAFTLAFIGYRFARTPGWHDQRWFWVLCASAGAYAFFDLAVALPVPEWVVILGAKGNLTVLSIHIFAWLVHAHAHLGIAPTVPARVAMGLSGAGVVLSPVGVMFSDKVIHHQVAWLGATFNEPVPTAAGQGLIAVLCLGLMYCIGLYLRAWNSHKDARPYVVSMSLLLAAGINDGLVGTGKVQNAYLLDAAFLPTIGIIGFVLVRRFVNEAKRLDALSTRLDALATSRAGELGRAQEALAIAERLAAVGRLATGVGHEINNPATAVITNLTYLQEALVTRGALPDDTAETLQDSQTAMDRITRVVRQLLHTGRVGESNRIASGPFDVNRVITAALQNARVALGGGPQASVTLDPGLRAIGEPLSLEQILTNLVTNSGQAVQNIGDRGRIEINAERRHGRVIITVSDNGPGMRPDVARRIFEPFFSTKPFGGGTGLGLSVSLGLARAIGADLRIAETSAAGTRMVVDLVEASSPLLVETPLARPATIAGPRRRILLVDDEEPLREPLRALLMDIFDIRLIAGVNEAMDLFRRGETFDAILCDLTLHHGGGAAFWARIRAEAPAHAPRVIFLASGTSDGVSREVLAKEGRPILYKPVDPWAAAEAVKAIIDTVGPVLGQGGHATPIPAPETA